MELTPHSTPDHPGRSYLPPVSHEPSLNLDDSTSPPMALPKEGQDANDVVYIRDDSSNHLDSQGEGLGEVPAHGTPPIPTSLPVVPGGVMPATERVRSSAPLALIPEVGSVSKQAEQKQPDAPPTPTAAVIGELGEGGAVFEGDVPFTEHIEIVVRPENRQQYEAVLRALGGTGARIEVTMPPELAGEQADHFNPRLVRQVIDHEGNIHHAITADDLDDFVNEQYPEQVRDARKAFRPLFRQGSLDRLSRSYRVGYTDSDGVPSEALLAGRFDDLITEMGDNFGRYRGTDVYMVGQQALAFLKEKISPHVRVGSPEGPLGDSSEEPPAVIEEPGPRPPERQSDDSGDVPPTNDKPGAPGMPEEEPERAAFEPYRQFVAAIDVRLTQGVPPDTIEGYIDSGGLSHVFETSDGHVVKLPRIPLSDEGSVPPDEARNEIINPRLLGKGIRGLEQMVAYTEENGGAVVCEKAPGLKLTDTTQEERDAIPREHFDTFLKTCKEMAERGINPDFNTTDNLLYDEQAGFTLIDYGIFEGEIPSAEEIGSHFVGVLFPEGITRRESILLPLEHRNFYPAYREAFGESAANTLLRKLQGYIL